MNADVKKALPTWTGEPKELADSLNILARRLELLGMELPEIVAGPGLRASVSPGRVILSATGGDTVGVASGNHPFKVLNASTTLAQKVRILPGLINYVFATVGGSANDQTSEADHFASAPRLTITGAGMIVLNASGGDAASPNATAGNITFVATAGSSQLPLAYVNWAGGKITSINQLRFDSCCCAMLIRPSANVPLWQ